MNPKVGFVDRPIDLPCGGCQGCREERTRMWALRCVHEAQMHERNCFVTLTYRDKDLPEGGTLRVEDWQKFTKRLRKKVGSFRYFHCGEYGEVNLRPHYHGCLFGVDFAGDRVLWKSDKGVSLYRSAVLEETWGLGFASVGNLTLRSAAYVARYIMKKAKADSSKYERVNKFTGECIRVRPEYLTMSRRPGLGTKWFEQFKSDVYPSDEVVYEGQWYRPPRFYDLMLSDDDLECYKARRRSNVARHGKDLIPERLLVREKVAAARVARLERNL